jgi:predicted RNase H-like HicB family nuclease
MLEGMAEYTVIYTRGRGGDWTARVRGLRRCRSKGRTLRQTRVRLRRALARFVEEPYAIDFVEDVKLPGPARKLVGQHWAARRKVARAQQAAQAASGRALEALRELSLNQKDAADLLGIPPLRLQQLWRKAG